MKKTHTVIQQANAMGTKDRERERPIHQNDKLTLIHIERNERKLVIITEFLERLFYSS